MGLLDDLEQQAEHARQRRVGAASGDRARRAEAAARLAPAMQHARLYFERLATHLADLDRVIEARYEIAGVGVLEGLAQGGYAVTEEPRFGEQAFCFRFRCEGRVPLTGRAGTEPVAGKIERELRDAGLRTQRVGTGGKVVTLGVEPRLLVSLCFAMDVEHGVLEFTARNLFGVGAQTHRFAPERVDTTLLDAIGRCVLREPGGFAELTGDTMSNDKRARLARDAARHKRRREAELGGPLRRAWFHISEAFRRGVLGQ